jgi:hypothetical protein
MSNRKFYRTVIEVVVLSEDPYDFTDLQRTAFDIVAGDCSGVCRVAKSEVCDAEQMAKYLQEQGSDPAFFGINEDE